VTNPVDYAWGQCTWFVAHSLSWLGVGTVGALGNASNWYGAAKGKGLQVGSTPVVGAVAVYNQNSPGSGGAGHVGVVTAVNTNGTFTLASDNWGGLGITHVATASVADLEGFIYPPSVAAGVQGAQNALTLAGNNATAVAGGTAAPGGGLSTTTAGLNVNPLDPNSIFNIGNDLSIAGSWVERGALILFGVVVLLMGLKMLFSASGNSGGGVTAIIGTPATPDTQEQTGQTTQTTRGPRGGKRGSVTTTRSRTVKGKKGSGIRGKMGKAAKAGAE
jgi:hypothetical protein